MTRQKLLPLVLQWLMEGETVVSELEKPSKSKKGFGYKGSQAQRLG